MFPCICWKMFTINMSDRIFHSCLVITEDTLCETCYHDLKKKNLEVTI